MGGKSGGGAATPYEAPNTLNSAQSLRVVDAVCEGEIKGFAYGNDEPWKSVFFDDTPVQNQDGSFNFKGVAGFFLRGTPDQGYIPGFDAVERTVSVGVEVKKHAAAVRAVTDARAYTGQRRYVGSPNRAGGGIGRQFGCGEVAARELYGKIGRGVLRRRTV